MLELSQSLSRPWSILSYENHTVLTYNTTVPDNHGAWFVSEVAQVPSLVSLGDTYLAHVSINSKNQIFIHRVREGFWVNPWHGAELVVKFPWEKLTSTVVNIIEFFLSWENRKEFAGEYLFPIMQEAVVPKGNKKHWQFRDHGFAFGLKYGKTMDGYTPINLDQVKPMIMVPELPVGIGLDGADMPSVWIPVTITSRETMIRNQEANLINKSFTFIPGSVLTPQLLSDTAHNLVKNDSKRYLPSIAKRGVDHEIIATDDDMRNYLYHPSVAKETHPRY